jgi:hypothetical protein
MSVEGIGLNEEIGAAKSCYLRIEDRRLLQLIDVLMEEASGCNPICWVLKQIPIEVKRFNIRIPVIEVLSSHSNCLHQKMRTICPWQVFIPDYVPYFNGSQ